MLEVRDQPVIALASFEIEGEEEEDEGEKEPFFLNYIESMPRPIEEFMTSRHPRFRKVASRTAGIDYYANLCECGANFGDNFLFSASEGAFAVDTEAQAGQIVLEQVPLEGRFEFRCGWSQGSGGLIFEHAQRVG